MQSLTLFDDDGEASCSRWHWLSWAEYERSLHKRGCWGDPEQRNHHCSSPARSWIRYVHGWKGKQKRKKKGGGGGYAFLWSLEFLLPPLPVRAPVSSFFLLIRWQWHLGQTEDHLPTRRGFNEYYGIPFSCDMGISAWNYFNETHPPYQASPLPLMVNEEVIEQPANLATLTERYANKTIDYLNHAR